jgi:hypothetical protein
MPTEAELRATLNMLSAELAQVRAMLLQLLHDAPATSRAVAVRVMLDAAARWAAPLPISPEIDAMQARAVQALADGYRDLLTEDPATRAALHRLNEADALPPAGDQRRDRLKVVTHTDQLEE